MRSSTHVGASWSRLDAHLPVVLVYLLLLGGWLDVHLPAVFVTWNTLTPDLLPSSAVGICGRVVRPPRSLLPACSPAPTPRGGLVGRRALAGDVGITAYPKCIPPELVNVTRNLMHRPLRRLRWLSQYGMRGLGVAQLCRASSVNALPVNAFRSGILSPSRINRSAIGGFRAFPMESMCTSF